MTPEQRQRTILEVLYKRKDPLEPEVETDLEEVWRECGSYGPKSFETDWEVLRKQGFVTGEPGIERIGNSENDRVTGTGRITAKGEKELKDEPSED